MRIFKNIINDTIEHQKMIAKFKDNGDLLNLEPLEEKLVITIPLKEYKELLIYKGKYLGLTNSIEKSELYADDNVVCSMINEVNE